MRPSEIRGMSASELEQKESDLREEIFRLRVRGVTGQVENKMKAREVRKDLARVLTIKQQKAGEA